MMEIENHLLVNIIEIIVIGRNHQWILIISGQKCDEKNQVICIVSKCLSTRYLLIAMGKVLT